MTKFEEKFTKISDAVFTGTIISSLQHWKSPSHWIKVENSNKDRIMKQKSSTAKKCAGCFPPFTHSSLLPCGTGQHQWGHLFLLRLLVGQGWWEASGRAGGTGGRCGVGGVVVSFVLMDVGYPEDCASFWGHSSWRCFATAMVLFTL